MLAELLYALPFVSIMLSIAVVLGGLAFRQTQIKELARLEGLATATYKSLNEAQAQQIARLARENVAMRAAFKHLGVEIEIEDGEIALIQSAKQRTSITRIPIREDSDKKKDTP